MTDWKDKVRVVTAVIGAFLIVCGLVTMIFASNDTAQNVGNVLVITGGAIYMLGLIIKTFKIRD